jgi:FMN reductase
LPDITSTVDEVARVSEWRPRILGLGGTTRKQSTSERALRIALDAAERSGAIVDVLTAEEIDLPSYSPDRAADDPRAQRLIEAMIASEGLVIATPAFHGGPSGLIKNALDYAEELRLDARPYLEGRAVACIVCAAGWQATATTLVALRSTVHALRGWPTPLGVTINTDRQGSEGVDPVSAATLQLELAAAQVVEFARWHHPANRLVTTSND